MNETPAENAVPAFAAGVKFRFDEVRKAWVVLAPERLFLPDEQAAAILQLVDGRRNLAAIVDELARIYQAPRELITGDAATMLRDLADKRVIRLLP